MESQEPASASSGSNEEEEEEGHTSSNGDSPPEDADVGDEMAEFLWDAYIGSYPAFGHADGWDDWVEENTGLLDYEPDSSPSEEDDEEGGEKDSPMDVGDVTASQVRMGQSDIQGIPWSDLRQQRSYYRLHRLQSYHNYRNMERNLSLIASEIITPRRDGRFFDFFFNTRKARPSVVHFQLRNLVWMTTRQDIYLPYNYRIWHWSSVERKLSEAMSLVRGPNGTENILAGTMAVEGSLCAAGGFQGEVMVKNLHTGDTIFSDTITHEHNAITNALQFHHTRHGNLHLISSNNDCFVRVFDVPTFTCLNRFRHPWAVNHTTASPDGRLLCVVGDGEEGYITDKESGDVLSTLNGHIDFSFATAWHLDGNTVATGNQDKTCRLWDVRFPSRAFAVLGGRIGAIRSTRFTADGQFLIIAEPGDFVHIYDVKQNYTRCQEIDLFGEIAGACTDVDTEALFIGISDADYGSLLEFERYRHSTYRNLLL